VAGHSSEGVASDVRKISDVFGVGGVHLGTGAALLLVLMVPTCMLFVLELQAAVEGGDDECAQSGADIPMAATAPSYGSAKQSEHIRIGAHGVDIGAYGVDIGAHGVDISGGYEPQLI
jgi:hypothetical protein